MNNRQIEDLLRLTFEGEPGTQLHAVCKIIRRRMAAFDDEETVVVALSVQSWRRLMLAVTSAGTLYNKAMLTNMHDSAESN